MNIREFQDHLAALSPKAFEDLVFDIFKASGKYTRLEKNPRISVHGTAREIDIAAFDDSFATPRRTLVEIKKRRLLSVDVIDYVVSKFQDLQGIVGPATMILVAGGQSVDDGARTSSSRGHHGLGCADPRDARYA